VGFDPTTSAQIRRYLYGGLDDTKLKFFRVERINKLYFRGVMSYYPIVDDEVQLKKLDGWLIHTLKQALRRRQNLWQSKNISIPGPYKDWIENIEKIKQMETPSGEIYDTRIPSFLHINRTMRTSLLRSGVKSVTNPNTIYYTGRLIINSRL
jgi:hypothetical protein